MKKNIRKLLSLMMTLTLALSLLPAWTITVAAAPPANWQDSGIPDISWYIADTSASSFTVSDADDLAGLAALVNDDTIYYDSGYKVADSGENFVAATDFSGKTIYLTSDIDLSAKEWMPICNGKIPISFSGTFDGQGHKITGLTMGTADSYSSNWYTGLFGRTENAVITDTGVDVTIYVGPSNLSSVMDFDQVMGTNAGGLVGVAEGGSISYCYSTGEIYIKGNDFGDGNNFSGGLVAYNSATITYSYSECDVVSSGMDDRIGGFVGVNEGLLEYSYAVGNVTSNSTAYNIMDEGVGGFVSGNYGKVLDCYATGNVSVAETGSGFFAPNPGGFAGYNGGTIGNCYYAGVVDFPSKDGVTIGGTFSGKNNATVVNACYDSSLGPIIPGIGYISTGLTTEEMQGGTGLNFSYYTSYTDSSDNTIAKADSYVEALNGCTDISGGTLTPSWTAESGSYPEIIVPVVGVWMRSVPVYVGENATFTAQAIPAIATTDTDKTISWSSSDTGVATVDDGVVTGISTGTAEITATAGDGEHYKSCTITVIEKKTDSTTANTFNVLGLVGASVSSSNTTVATADLTTLSGYITIKSLAPGTATITVTDASSHTAAIEVTVEADGSITIGTITKYVGYTIEIGSEAPGGAGYTRDITITVDDIDLSGKYLLAEFTSGSGTSAKVSVVLISLSADSLTNTISYQLAGTTVEVWLTDGMPNLTAGDTGVTTYAHASTN